MADLNSISAWPLDSDASLTHWFETKRRWILVLAIGAAVFWTILFLQFTVDDAFISLRYGKNLVSHHVWNWNASGMHEEAYTSFVYTVLGIIPALLHIPPALFFKFVGLACVGMMVYRLRTVSTTPFAYLLGILLIGLHPWVWIHAYAGLETPLYMLLLLEMALAVHRAPTTSPLWTYTLFLLLPLTRPEGIVFACVGVMLYWRQRGDAPKRYVGFAVALILGGLYFFVRWHYFQHLLPNPVYFKLAASSGAETRQSILNNLTESKGHFAVLLLLCLFARRSYTRVFAMSGIVLLLLLYAPHEMHMNYSERFYFQIAFPFLLFFFMTEDLASTARVAVVAATISLFSLYFQALPNALHQTHFYLQPRISLGKYLAPFAENHTMFNPDSGVIPYYSGWKTYDHFGLGTYRIAKYGVTVPLLQEIRPDLLLIYSPRPGMQMLYDYTPFDHASRNAEIEVALHSGEYEYVGDCGSHGTYSVEFLRKDTPQHDEIVRALEDANAGRSSTESRLPLKDLLLQRLVP